MLAAGSLMGCAGTLGSRSRRGIGGSSRYGGMKAGDAKRLKELEAENARLKKLIANQALDIDMLRELAEGDF